MDELNKEVHNINRIISEIYGEFKNIRKIGYDAHSIIKYDSSQIDRFGSFKFFKINGGYILKPLADENAAVYSHSLSLSDFIGIDNIIKDVFQNTMKFASGKPANNVLLWGDRGTGKSSLIRALAKSFGEPPYLNKIKFIEVVEDTAELIYELITVIKLKPYRFILIFDDIAFDADTPFYKKLKSILDGGLDELPENIIIYATSNKRHLTKEMFSTKKPDSDFIHPEEEAEEGLSLSDRFGLTYGLYSFDQETYLKIVELYLKKYGVKASSVDMEGIRKNAVNYAVIKGSRSGRTAKQFAISLIKDN
ncbi:MAG: ATP-binding protein [Deltaproteobacteria bacterium]|jgi:predicted AAA+ superfamily ATPase|nr:ATP-binding protein [Deltaproteobacteria bacterium]